MIPIIGTLLSNGLSLIANAVMAKGKEYVKEKTGVDLDKGALSQQDMVSLKKYEMEHEEELLKLKLEENKLDIEEMKAYMADVDSARKRESEMATSAQAPLISKIATPVLAFVTITLTFALFYMVVFGDMVELKDTNRKDIVIYILGVLSAIATQIFSYYFGSSSGSADKAKTIDTMLGRR